MIVKDIINKLKECDDFHNRCDCLLEHDEITYLLEYIKELQERIDKAIEYNEHLIRDAKYHLNLGHLKKMKKILKGEE